MYIQQHPSLSLLCLAVVTKLGIDKIVLSISRFNTLMLAYQVLRIGASVLRISYFALRLSAPHSILHIAYYISRTGYCILRIVIHC